MRVKLNKAQANDLFHFVTFLLTMYPFQHRREKLLDILVNKIRLKLRTKIESSYTKSFSIKLAEEEALAFEEWMEQIEAVLPKSMYVYEQTFTKQITNEINRTVR